MSKKKKKKEKVLHADAATNVGPSKRCKWCKLYMNKDALHTCL